MKICDCNKRTYKLIVAPVSGPVLSSSMMGIRWYCSFYEIFFSHLFHCLNYAIWIVLICAFFSIRHLGREFLLDLKFWGMLIYSCTWLKILMFYKTLFFRSWCSTRSSEFTCSKSWVVIKQSIDQSRI